MKTTDLMLGDWVMFRDTPYTIATIASQDMVMVAEGEETKFYKAGSLKPIPLTEDLLKANGWEYDKEQSSWLNSRVYNTHGLPLFIYADDNAGQFFFCDYITIDSVHELQHCLRLVGQKDLAGNFKVEQL